MKIIEFKLESEGMAEIAMAADEAMEQVVEAISEGKSDQGKVSVSITFDKHHFKDGYGKIREGLNVNYKVDHQIINKGSHGSQLPTDNMMLEESETFGWYMRQAPDPQMSLDDYEM